MAVTRSDSNQRARIAADFRRRFDRDPELVVRAPGRVTLLGAHVDYNDGWVLPAAVDRAVWLAASPAAGPESRVQALDFREEAHIDLERLPPPVPQRTGGSGWVDYPAGVAWALREAGFEPGPIEAVFGSDIPIGAGISSSAAVETAFLLAWRELFELAVEDREIPHLGQRVENVYVGVQCGIMDTFASFHGAENTILLLDCRHLTLERLPFPPEAVVLVADSGVRRELASPSTGYNDRPAECRRAVGVLRRHLPGIRALRDVSIDDFERFSHHLPMDLRRRVRHVVEECRRVLDGAEALRRGDAAAFGGLVRQSHLSSRDLYEVSIPELDVLAAAAWSAPGCHGARLMGGGCGGCVAALVDGAAVETVGEGMASAFEEAFGRRPQVFECRIGGGARIVE